MIDYFDVIKSRSGVPVDDYWAMIWAQSISETDWDIITITGTLPLTFEAKGEALQNYRLYGTENGAGVETENLWDENYENISISMTYKPLNVGNGSFTLSTNTPLGNGGSSLFLMPGQQSSGASTAMYGVYDGSPRTVTSVDGYVTLVYRVYDNKDPRNYQTMLVEGSTAPTTYIPFGYQIPLTNTSGETENKLNPQDVQAVTINNNTRWGIPFILPAGSYTFKAFNAVADSYIYAIIKHSDDSYSGMSYVLVGNTAYTKTLTLVEGDTLYIYNAYANGTQAQTISKLTDGHVMLVLGSTAPDHYIPHRYETSYNLYIGDTQLGAEEYVDYQEQKIYRTILLTTHDNKDFITSDNKRFCVRRSDNA